MSPIKGLSEKRRLPRLGKIHLGVKAKNARGTEYPRMVDYFVCPPEVQAVFGEKPKELKILIPVEDEDKWASQYYRCYCRSRGLVCKGDGETCTRMVDVKTGELADGETKEAVMKEMECRGRECADYGVRCKEVMNLQFLLPEVPGLGVWQIDTSSVNSIKNINSTANLLRLLYGRVSMIPLLLTVEQLEVNGPEGKKKKVSVLNLRTNETVQALSPCGTLTAQPVSEGTDLANGEIITPDEAIALPTSDDEYPEMIVPQEQAPPGEEPLPEPPHPQVQKEEERSPAQTKKAEPVLLQGAGRDPDTIRTVTDLYRACNQDFQMQPKDVLQELGAKSRSAINGTPAECYRKIANAKQQA